MRLGRRSSLVMFGEIWSLNLCGWGRMDGLRSCWYCGCNSQSIALPTITKSENVRTTGACGRSDLQQRLSFVARLRRAAYTVGIGEDRSQESSLRTQRSRQRTSHAHLVFCSVCSQNEAAMNKQQFRTPITFDVKHRMLK